MIILSKHIIQLLVQVFLLIFGSAFQQTQEDIGAGTGYDGRGGIAVSKTNGLGTYKFGPYPDSNLWTPGGQPFLDKTICVSWVNYDSTYSGSASGDNGFAFINDELIITGSGTGVLAAYDNTDYNVISRPISGSSFRIGYQNAIESNVYAGYKLKAWLLYPRNLTQQEVINNYNILSSSYSD